jgi:excisionase family DNA binding protein
MLVQLNVGQFADIMASICEKALARREREQQSEILTLTEAAEFLKRHRKAVMKLVYERDLPAHHISKREVRFRRSELLDWLAKNRPEDET